MMTLKLLSLLMLAATAFGQTVKGTWVPVNVPNIPVNVTNVPWFFDKGFQINFISVDFGQWGPIAVVHYTPMPLLAPREQMIGEQCGLGDNEGSCAPMKWPEILGAYLPSSTSDNFVVAAQWYVETIDKLRERDALLDRIRDLEADKRSLLNDIERLERENFAYKYASVPWYPIDRRQAKDCPEYVENEFGSILCKFPLLPERSHSASTVTRRTKKP